MLRHSKEFGPADIESVRFRRQWVLLPAGSPVRVGWRTVELAHSYMLQYHPDLVVHTRQFGAGIAAILGIAVDTRAPNADAVHGMTSLDTSGITSWLLHAAGAYALVVSDADGLRVFTDPAALMPIFFSRDVVASTPALIPGLTEDVELAREYTLHGSDDQYTGSLTPYRDIKYLTANHCLEMFSGAKYRFWPLAENYSLSTDEAVTQIADLMIRIMAGYYRQGHIVQSLTGGKDTRVVLAASRDVIRDADVFTIRSSGVSGSDITIAQQLASIGGFPLNIVDSTHAPTWLLSLYDENCARMSIGTRRSISDACLQLSGTNVIHIGGILGEIFRAHYWPSGDPTVVSHHTFTNEFVNKAPCVIAGVDEWIRSLPEGIAPCTAYDLMLFEERQGGRWGGIGCMASSLFYSWASPFSSREVFDLTSRVDKAVRNAGELYSLLIGTMWPSLLSVPFPPSRRHWTRHIPKSLRVLYKALSRLPR